MKCQYKNCDDKVFRSIMIKLSQGGEPLRFCKKHLFEAAKKIFKLPTKELKELIGIK